MREVIDLTPDLPDAVVVISRMDDTEHLTCPPPLTLAPERTTYKFQFDGVEYTPEKFRKLVRRGLKLAKMEDAGPGGGPRWEFVIGPGSSKPTAKPDPNQCKYTWKTGDGLIVRCTKRSGDLHSMHVRETGTTRYTSHNML